jgi:hypothetical protein
MDNLQIDTYLVGPIVHSCHRMRRCRPFPWCCTTCSFGGDGVCVVQHLLTAKGTGDAGRCYVAARSVTPTNVQRCEERRAGVSS